MKRIPDNQDPGLGSGPAGIRFMAVSHAGGVGPDINGDYDVELQKLPT